MNSGAPPPGWVAINGKIEPGARVCDYAARLQEVKANCTATGCRRHLVLDPEQLCKKGLGPLRMDQLKQLYLCHRLEGCGLNYFNEKPEIRLRLDQFVGMPNVRIRLKCRGEGCNFARAHLVEAIIQGLEKRMQGNGGTLVDDLAPKLTAGCPLCKKKNWEVSILWANVETMGWRTAGRDYFDRFATG